MTHPSVFVLFDPSILTFSISAVPLWITVQMFAVPRHTVISHVFSPPYTFLSLLSSI